MQLLKAIRYHGRIAPSVEDKLYSDFGLYGHVCLQCLEGEALERGLIESRTCTNASGRTWIYYLLAEKGRAMLDKISDEDLEREFVAWRI